MDSFLKLKSEFDNLVSKIKIPGSEVSCKPYFNQMVVLPPLLGITLKKIENGVDRRTNEIEPHKVLLLLAAPVIENAGWIMKCANKESKLESRQV